MVLKKSNTPFNSGATQRCFNKGLVRVYQGNETPMLSFSLRGIPVYDKDNRIRALEKIYDYLGFPGLGLKIFHHSSQRNSLDISLNKQKLWLIPERIESLKREKDFLEPEDGLSEIHINKEKKIANRRTLFKKESCILKTKEEEDVTKSKKTNKRKTEGRRRGLQRPHLQMPQPRDEGESDAHAQGHQERRWVEIELGEIDHIDARVLKSGTYNFSCCRGRKVKSMSKTKGFVNGRQSYKYREYNPSQLRTEIRHARHYDTVWAEDFGGYYDDNTEIVEDSVDLECYHNRHQQQTFDYFVNQADFTRPKRKHNRSKSKENLHINDDLVNVNTASSKTTFKHPKGSVQLIPKPFDVDGDRCSTTSSENNFVLVEDKMFQDSFLEVDQIQDDAFEHIDIPIAFNTFETQDNFVAVNLHFPKDIQEIMNACLLQSNFNNVLVSDWLLTLGNCFPPVFCVDLEQSDSVLEYGWNLIGISTSDLVGNADLKWEVTLKNSQVGYENSIVMNNFLHNLDSFDNCTLEFDTLICIALASVRSVSHYSIHLGDTPASTRNHLLVINDSKVPSPEVCSIEEAVKKIRDNRKEKTHEDCESLSLAEINTCLDIPDGSVECDICLNTCDKYGQKDSGIVTLLPCNHSFCYECWRAHLFHHTMAGTVDIKCMETNCKHVINETTMKAFIPERHFAKVNSHRLERCIDTSPLTQWCPNTKCNNVSMISEESQFVTQFGCHVLCDCKRSYCFSCQATPHWPMSCSQAAAYRNILSKLGDELIHNQLMCNVDLKPCPGCKYPIEKYLGCPHMICRMCGYSFCWNCLQSTATHRVWECKTDPKSTFVTFQLENEVVNDFPLKFLNESLKMRKRHKSIKKMNNSRGWSKGLMSSVDSKNRKLSFERSLQLEGITMVKAKAILLATDSVSFIIDCYSFLEFFYILLSFSLLNKEKNGSKSYYRHLTKHVVEGLVFTAVRLEELVIGKPLRQLLTYGNIGQMHLVNGQEMLKRLKAQVPSIQRSSKNVPAQPIGELDPKNYIRYK